MARGGAERLRQSSVYQDADIEAFARSVWIINPDVLTARIQRIEGLDLRPANLQAVQRIEVGWKRPSGAPDGWRGNRAFHRQISSPRDLAKTLRFEARLTYVILDAPKRNVERVRLRVKKGGHAVPEDKIIACYGRSLEQLPWFLEQAEQASIFDNSAASPRLIGRKKDGVVTLDPDALPQILSAVQMIATE